LKRDDVLALCRVTKHQYYYVAKAGRRGRKPSSTTLHLTDGGELEEVDNDLVLEQMLIIKSDPETDYGYRAMTAALMLLGYIINHKKVYRLMKTYQLLHDKVKRAKRTYAKYRRVNSEYPLQVIEMDIKFQWVSEHSRYAFILTVIDCFTRKVLAWTVAYSIKQAQVKQLWDKVIVDYLQPEDMLGKDLSIEVRNDNDSRFAAQQVQQYFADNHLNQVFTHPYTPQENGHIESFHAILSRSLLRQHFSTIAVLEKHLNHFYKVYNTIRLHGSLDHLAPDIFWKLWKQGLIERIELPHYKVKFKLKIMHYQLSGKGNLREVSCLLEEQFKSVNGATTFKQPSVQKSPAVVSCNTNLIPLT